MADFVGSGSVQRIQSTIVHLNRVTPASGELRKLTTQFTADISDLSNNIDNVDRLLNGVAQTAEVLHSRIPSVQRWFSPEGMRGFDRGIQAISLVGYSFPSLGTIYSGGFWLVPLFNSLADAVGAMQRDKRAFEAEYPAWWRLFRESFLPQDKYPAINITSILGPDGRELSGNTQDVLRILGAMP
jgi:hypothetical protein